MSRDVAADCLRQADGPPTQGERHILRAFIATGSMNDECLTTANATNADSIEATSDVFCDNLDLNGIHGIVLFVELADPMPADRVFVVTVWQKGAQQYADPVYCPC